MMTRTRRLGVVWANQVVAEACSRRQRFESGQDLCRREIVVVTMTDVEIKVRSGAFRDRRCPSSLEQSEVSRAVGREFRAFERHAVSFVPLCPTGTTSIRHAPRQRPMWTMA